MNFSSLSQGLLDQDVQEIANFASQFKFEEGLANNEYNYRVGYQFVGKVLEIVAEKGGANASLMRLLTSFYHTGDEHLGMVPTRHALFLLLIQPF